MRSLQIFLRYASPCLMDLYPKNLMHMFECLPVLWYSQRTAQETLSSAGALFRRNKHAHVYGACVLIPHVRAPGCQVMELTFSVAPLDALPPGLPCRFATLVMKVSKSQ
jgi:hypothetical protein